MTTLPAVFAYAKSMSEAIICLKNQRHTPAAVMLTYAAIDQMAWLSVKDEQNGGDFKAWVDKYMLGPNPIGCSSSELWAARNAVLHTGGAMSRNHTKKSPPRKIYYTSGPIAGVTNTSDAVFLRIEDLVTSYINGVARFSKYLEGAPGEMDIANQKVAQTFSHIPTE